MQLPVRLHAPAPGVSGSTPQYCQTVGTCTDTDFSANIFKVFKTTVQRLQIVEHFSIDIANSAPRFTGVFVKPVPIPTYICKGFFCKHILESLLTRHMFCSCYLLIYMKNM
jgi:hypothetical protein